MTEKNHTGTKKRLVLGFDAGCGTCADIAERVQGKVGDKLAVENLNDPQLIGWRKEALGEDAPWAPTLFEVEGDGVVRALTGWRMGLALSRKLGPADTWRAMQALGENGGEVPTAVEGPYGNASPAGMSRAQFLKGVGGAAVAMTALSGGVLFPSVALGHNASGTAQQQSIAKAVVQRSKPFQNLADLQAKIGSSFNFTNAKIWVNATGTRASIGIVAPHKRIRAVWSEFRVNLITKSLISYEALIYVPLKNGEEVKVTYFHNGRLPKFHHQTRFGKNYVATYDNRLISHEQWEKEAKAYRAKNQQRQQRATTNAKSSDSYQACLDAAEAQCGRVMNRMCLGFGLGALGFGAVSAGVGTALGAGVLLSCYIVNEWGCPAAAQDSCKKEPPPAPIQQPPAYYC